MKVLHIIYTKGISGAEKYLKDLLPGLKKEGIDGELMLVSPGLFSNQLMSYCEEMEKLGIKTTCLSAGRPGFLRAAWKISGYLKKNKIDIIHSHLFNADLIAALIKQFFYKKIFIFSTKHGYSEKVLNEYTESTRKVKHDLYYRVTRYALGKIDRNISISDGISNLYMNLGFARERYPVISHGINIDPLPQKNADEPYRQSPNQLIIVGRLEEFKGHHYLLEAMPEMTKQIPDLKLLVLGEGSRTTQLQEQVNRLELQEHVSFLGFCKDPYSYMTNSDVIIMPSSFEPFGLVFIESFALRVPVVAFDAPAGNEIISDNETGMLVPRNDSVKLASTIIHLLQQPAERERISANAYLRFIEYYNTARMCRDTAAFYRECR